MGVIAEINRKFADEFDKELASNQDYRKAEKELHDYITDNIPDDKQEKIDSLVSNLASSVARVSTETGMKIGAKIVVELLK